jgi:hypothetical protein
MAAGVRGLLRVVVVAHPRSGSNSLVEILDLHPDIAMLNEPFNENFTTWELGNENYLERVRDVSSLAAVLDEIFADYTGIKILTYQLPAELLGHVLLHRDYRVVVLRRRNLLETAVSNLIALQTNLWKTWDATAPLEDYYRALRPLDLNEVRRIIKGTQALNAQVDSVLADRRDGVLHIAYEDLFLAPPDRQQSQLAELWSFLGVPSIEDPRVREYLDPAAVQMASIDTYGQLPNAAEINQRLGSDEIGYLGFA